MASYHQGEKYKSISLFNICDSDSKESGCLMTLLPPVLNVVTVLYWTEWSIFLLWLMQGNKTQKPKCQWAPRRSLLDPPPPLPSTPLPLSPSTKSNWLSYCSKILPFNLLINCWIVLQRKRLSSSASLQRSHLQPVCARTCARSQRKTLAGVLAEKDGCRDSASVKEPTCKDIGSSSFNIHTWSTVYLLPSTKWRARRLRLIACVCVFLFMHVCPANSKSRNVPQQSQTRSRWPSADVRTMRSDGRNETERRRGRDNRKGEEEVRAAVPRPWEAPGRVHGGREMTGRAAQRR